MRGTRIEIGMGLFVSRGELFRKIVAAALVFSTAALAKPLA
jgi:hypothetical protein